MSEEKSIPKGWSETTVDLIGELLRGVSYKKEYSSNVPLPGYVPILRANNINGELNFDDLVFVHKKYLDDFQYLKKGDIVFAMSSGSKNLVGKSAKAKSDFNGGWGAFCAAFRPYEFINKDLIAYFFQAPNYKRLIACIAKGTNINNLKREHIVGLQFPLPPLPEQHRIVAKIEELFSSVDEGIESLKSAQVQLKVYRQAVLKWAFEGRLTNKDLKEGELPKGWKFKRVDEIASVNPKLPFENISDDLEVSFLPMKHVEEVVNKINLVEFRKYGQVKKGFTPMTDRDVIFAKITPCMENGKIAIVHSLKNKIAFGSTEFHVFRCLEGYFNSYLFHFLVQERTRQEAERNMTGAVGQRRVPKKFLENLEIPIPLTIQEQKLIVSEIESRLSVCDKIEESLHTALQQAKALRQSILKKAFEGKLVPQDTNDEPASVLLERIRAERGKYKTGKTIIKQKT